jgi:hypothetical protein
MKSKWKIYVMGYNVGLQLAGSFGVPEEKETSGQVFNR